MIDKLDGLPHILVVDDDPSALRIVAHTLEQAGFDVDTATSGELGLQRIKRHGFPHLAIVDYNMPPGMSGVEFCRAVTEYCDLPIIMLTAVDKEEEIVRSLEQFADDYVVKPFDPNQLVARVRRILRRTGSFAYTAEDKVSVDERLVIDFPGREAIVDGTPISLTPTENKLLYLLVRNAGRTITTDFLLRRLWPDGDGQEDRLHVHIHRLRRKIEPDHGDPTYIVSKRGQGYSFAVRPDNVVG